MQQQGRTTLTYVIIIVIISHGKLGFGCFFHSLYRECNRNVIHALWSMAAITEMT